MTRSVSRGGRGGTSPETSDTLHPWRVSSLKSPLSYSPYEQPSEGGFAERPAVSTLAQMWTEVSLDRNRSGYPVGLGPHPGQHRLSRPPAEVR